MDFLKFIPQLFYDLISRVIPGGFLLLALAIVTSTPFGNGLTDFFVGAPALQQSPFFLGLTIFVVSYIVGQLLAPLSDLYERRLIFPIVPKSWRVTADALEDQNPTHFTASMGGHLAAELNLEKIQKSLREVTFQKAVFVWYDWLRSWDPEAGARAAKVRAEYRMHAGLATASWLALVVRIGVQIGARSWSGWPLGLGMACVGGLGTWGLIRTFRTFQWIVMNQHYVARAGGKGGAGAV